MIIMLAGKRKSGKSLAADTIVMQRPEFKVVSFADAVREEFCTIYNVPLSSLRDNYEKEKYRPLVKTFAEQRREEKGRFHYANLLFKMLYPDEHYIIDDLRCIEELEVGLNFGAKPYKVFTYDNTRKQRGWVYNPEIDDHYLETEMDLCQQTYTALGGDIIYNTTQNKEDLHRRVQDMLRRL